MKTQENTGIASGARALWRGRAASRALLPAAAAALLMACSASLLPKPDPTPARFTLDGGAAAETPIAVPARPAAAAPVLFMAPMRAAPGYDSTRMLYQRRPLELEAFAFHAWLVPPAQMLGPLLQRALLESGAFRVVLTAETAAGLAGATGTAGPMHWRLHTELLRLQQDFSQRPSRIRLTVRAQLVDGRAREALAWREFDITVDAAGEDPVSGAAAAQAASQQLFDAVIAFCGEQLPATGEASAAHPAPPEAATQQPREKK